MSPQPSPHLLSNDPLGPHLPNQLSFGSTIRNCHINDPDGRARAEARNGLRQFDLGVNIVEDALTKGREYRLRPSAVLALHRTGLEGIPSRVTSGLAGIEIQGGKHTPPGAHLVPELVEDMCDYVNASWSTSTPVHSGAYVMWRLNWIHPFVDGNGRTSRVLSYIVLCTRMGFRPQAQ
jgi:Fic family protein